jgi:hypothetical protein
MFLELQESVSAAGDSKAWLAELILVQQKALKKMNRNVLIGKGKATIFIFETKAVSVLLLFKEAVESHET